MRGLVFSIDDPYVTPFQVLFHSLHVTDSIPEGTPIFIIHQDELAPDSIATIKDFVAKCGHEVTFVDASGAIPGDLPLSEGDHVSRATFYRLFVATILPGNIDSVLYLDADTLVVRSIRDLFRVELNAPIAAVDHLMSLYGQFKMWGWSGGSYFQAGVILIDLERWRSDQSVNVFLDIMKRQRHRIQWWDQDILNIAFEGRWQRLDIWYNVCRNVTKEVPMEVLEQNVRLIHFDGSDKPWQDEVSRPFSDSWRKSYMETFGPCSCDMSPPPADAHSRPGFMARLRAVLCRGE